ncbi:MAG TPA: Clp protease N-terminal domain-containing protein [Trebonia sp.]
MTSEGEPAEDTEEANVLRWLRQRLSRRAASPRAEAPEVLRAAPRGTPAVEAALHQAAELAGELPVGSHHLLLAALGDANSAASLTLASLGVDIDELRQKLRSARVAGTSDEQPEQAGRRQMTIQVTDEMLTIVATDPVIVAAGKEALSAVNARAEAAARSAGKAAEAGGTAGEEPLGEEPADEKSATDTVIRGDLPAAAGLANVWLELRETLSILADPTRGRRVVRARNVRLEFAQQGDRTTPDEPDEPGAPAASS